jgi:uncharacterized membrane protein YidH (DUF202 family)
MLFILGVFLICIGVLLSTYTTVTFINATSNYGLKIFAVPATTKIQPYQLVGIITILFGVAFVGIGIYETEKKRVTVPEQ